MGYSSDHSSDSDLEGPVVGTHHACFDDKVNLPDLRESLPEVAMRAFGLGLSLAVSLVALVLVRLWYPSSPHWRHAFYGATLSVFHFFEFWATARYNSSAASAKSFFPTRNLPVYLSAHAFAFIECVVSRILYWRPDFSPFLIFGARLDSIWVMLGFLLVCVGQLVRTLAIVHAGSVHSPSEQSDEKRRGGRRQVLVTTGIYRILRHPAYFGFFWWAIGTQMVLCNKISFLAAVAVLWSIFAGQVKREEESLRRSLGRPYLDYQRRVGTMMPFIGSYRTVDSKA